MKYRIIESFDDQRIAQIIRTNLEKAHLDIPGTAYFDSQLDHLSAYYNTNKKKHIYFVVTDEDNLATGGVGVEEFEGFPNCAEIQKLYLDDDTKGKGYGKELMSIAENWAKENGFQWLYLETHSNLTIAMNLYEKLGFKEIERPESVLHGTMDHFYLKKLEIKEL